jgi:hypothetical protein
MTVRIILLIGLALSSSSCASTPHRHTAEKYPHKPADNPERKSGQAMLFYEAAEEDADPNKVIVTPPAEENTEYGKKPAQGPIDQS